MSDDKKHRDRIPSRDLTAYERWELPALDDRGNEVFSSRIEERNMRPLTAGEMERMHREAWEEGHREGRTEGYDKGYREGHEAGYADGHQQGVAEGEVQGREQAVVQTRQQVESGLARLEPLMQELLKPIDHHRDEVETALLNLCCALARAVVYREIRIDSSQIRQVVSAALDMLPDTAEQISIHVHPSDLEWTREVVDRIHPGCNLVPDDNVMPGGCWVDSRRSLVDFTVEKRFQKTIQQMLDGQLARGDGSEASLELDAVMGELTDFHREVLEQPVDDPASRASDGQNRDPSSDLEDRDSKADGNE